MSGKPDGDAERPYVDCYLSGIRARWKTDCYGKSGRNGAHLGCRRKDTRKADLKRRRGSVVGRIFVQRRYIIDGREPKENRIMDLAARVKSFYRSRATGSLVT